MNGDDGQPGVFEGVEPSQWSPLWYMRPVEDYVQLLHKKHTTTSCAFTEITTAIRLVPVFVTMVRRDRIICSYTFVVQANVTMA